jgi:hypothetical protein
MISARQLSEIAFEVEKKTKPYIKTLPFSNIEDNDNNVSSFVGYSI